MDPKTTEPLVILALVLVTAGATWGVRIYLHHRRRLAFRAAAVRAGLDPGEGPWVDASCAATRIAAHEEYVYRGQKETQFEAKLPGAFPEAFHASTREQAVGLLRSSFKTTSGVHTVYVRGLDEEATLAFLTDEVRLGLAEGLALAPDAVITPNLAKFVAYRWYRAGYLEGMFAGFSRLCRAFAPLPAAYRDAP